MNLFDNTSEEGLDPSSPLADRMRPEKLSQFVGQTHVVGKGTLVRSAIENDRIFSMILWGPPGCGKTTLARIIASATRSFFVHFSAVLAGVKEIRGVIAEAQNQQKLYRKRTILFVDEIHRFNKSQQDAFLHHVESGLITLIGATTENPSFEVISPLLSRCRVITLKMLTAEDIAEIINHTIKDSERGLGALGVELEDAALTHLVRIADGDARMALNSLEVVAALLANKSAPSKDQPRVIAVEDLERALQKKALEYRFLQKLQCPRL